MANAKVNSKSPHGEYIRHGYLTQEGVNLWNDGKPHIPQVTESTLIEIKHYPSGLTAVCYAGTCAWVTPSDYCYVGSKVKLTAAAVTRWNTYHNSGAYRTDTNQVMTAYGEADANGQVRVIGRNLSVMWMSPSDFYEFY